MTPKNKKDKFERIEDIVSHPIVVMGIVGLSLVGGNISQYYETKNFYNDKSLNENNKISYAKAIDKVYQDMPYVRHIKFGDYLATKKYLSEKNKGGEK
ncbi:hypothetical protein HYS72_00320 [Candidatus Pacearchaeota archaeon]|nr:hypothetical protein [Candidatus Pacearchaeota archaeon]